METNTSLPAVERPRRARAETRVGVRTTLNLPAEAVSALHELAEARNTTFTEVIRRALSLEKYVLEATRDGGRILIEDADKTLKQLVFF